MVLHVTIRRPSAPFVVVDRARYHRAARTTDRTRATLSRAFARPDDARTPSNTAMVSFTSPEAVEGQAELEPMLGGDARARDRWWRHARIIGAFVVFAALGGQIYYKYKNRKVTAPKPLTPPEPAKEIEMDTPKDTQSLLPR